MFAKKIAGLFAIIFFTNSGIRPQYTYNSKGWADKSHPIMKRFNYLYQFAVIIN